MARSSAKLLSSKLRSAEIALRLQKYYLDLRNDPNYVELTDYGEYIEMCADNDFAYEPGQGI